MSIYTTVQNAELEETEMNNVQVCWVSRDRQKTACWWTRNRNTNQPWDAAAVPPDHQADFFCLQSQFAFFSSPVRKRETEKTSNLHSAPSFLWMYTVSGFIKCVIVLDGTDNYDCGITLMHAAALIVLMLVLFVERSLWCSWGFHTFNLTLSRDLKASYRLYSLSHFKQ